MQSYPGYRLSASKLSQSRNNQHLFHFRNLKNPKLKIKVLKSGVRVVVAEATAGPLNLK